MNIIYRNCRFTFVSGFVLFQPAAPMRTERSLADRETEAQGGSPCRRASRGRPWSCLLSRDPCPRCAGPQGQAPQFSLRGAGKGPGHRSGPAQKQRPDRLPRSQKPGRGRRPEGDGAGPAGRAPISAGKLTSEAGRSALVLQRTSLRSDGVQGRPPRDARCATLQKDPEPVEETSSSPTEAPSSEAATAESL
ncbi:uncharacterized protein [Equus asinus]|uniref:uncharacterized protein n=1 Tax=Equus asinus TaxID=9793 RepID=UPI0038F80C55